MKHQILLTTAIALAIADSLFAQGSLTPPGAPGPVMKSLAQVEPRIPISSVPFIITNPGSYYLTTNLAVTTSNAITISASDVTLDLRGFTISSTDSSPSPTGAAILLDNNANPALRDVTIFNGVISSGYTNNAGTWTGAGFNSGIFYSGAGAPPNVRVRNVSVYGCFNYGILIGLGSSVVESCTVQSVGTYGIYANSVCRSVVTLCGNNAIIGDVVSDSYGQSIGSGDGIYCNTANNCEGLAQSGYGVYAGFSANGCYGQSATGYGLDSGGTAVGCYGSSSSEVGVAGQVVENCYGSSGGTGGLGYGVYASTAENCYGTGGYVGVNGSVTAQNCYGVATGSGNTYGVNGSNLMNCYGISSGAYGCYAFETAIGCYGQCAIGTSGIYGLYAHSASACTAYHFGGTAIFATVANGCWADQGTNNITYKYNMP